MLKSTRWSSTPCTVSIVSSGGMAFFLLIFLVQAFTATEYASAEEYRNPPLSGFKFPGPYPPDQYPGQQYPGTQQPFFYPPHKSPGPIFSEDDLICLIGTDLEVPYPLYKEISESFLSTSQILVLLPNNTIVQVSGYVGLKDIAKVDPDDTKVLISSDTMIPAAIYLRVVLIQPEEIMIRLPDGQILPHQIYKEQYGEKFQTLDKGGQTYFQSVSPKDAFPFLVVNDPKRGQIYVNTFPFSSADTGQSAPSQESVTNYPEFGLLPHYPEPVPALYYPRPKPIPQYPEPIPVPHYSKPKNVPRYPEHTPGPYNPERNPVLRYPEPSSFSYSPEHKPPPTPSHPGQALTSYGEPKRPVSEQKTFLPTGVHIMETSRCSICDPDSDGAHVTVFTV